MKPKPHNAVHHPAHYTSGPSCEHCGKTIECIVITEPLSFCLGNATKYIWRAGLKSADAVTDLAKSVWYLQREIARLGKAAK